MKIDKIYLDEARRIRADYLKNLEEIKSKVPFIEQHKKKINSYNNMLETIVNSGKPEQEKEKELMESLEQLNRDVDVLMAEIQPYYIEIEKLMKCSDKLYLAIQEKYVGIEIDEIKNQIIPYVSDL